VGKDEIASLLTHLAVEKHVAATAQNQALAAVKLPDRQEYAEN
jgi:hypothetical protein